MLRCGGGSRAEAADDDLPGNRKRPTSYLDEEGEGIMGAYPGADDIDFTVMGEEDLRKRKASLLAGQHQVEWTSGFANLTPTNGSHRKRFDKSNSSGNSSGSSGGTGGGRNGSARRDKASRGRSRSPTGKKKERQRKRDAGKASSTKTEKARSAAAAAGGAGGEDLSSDLTNDDNEDEEDEKDVDFSSDDDGLLRPARSDSPSRFDIVVMEQSRSGNSGRSSSPLAPAPAPAPAVALAVATKAVDSEGSAEAQPEEKQEQQVSAKAADVHDEYDDDDDDDNDDEDDDVESGGGKGKEEEEEEEEEEDKEETKDSGGGVLGDAAAGGVGGYDADNDGLVVEPANERGQQLQYDGEDLRTPSVVLHLIKKLKPGQDLSSFTTPSFIQENRSMLEKFTDVGMHVDLLLQAEATEDPVQRLLGVLKWYLASYHYKTRGLKKPLNPILGETFACRWFCEGSVTEFYAEQTLHHPPQTCVYLENRERGIACASTFTSKSKFKGNSAVAYYDDGSLLRFLRRDNERYGLSLPYVYVKGIMMGRLRIELGNKAQIVAHDTGLAVDLEFKATPTFGGRGNGVSAVVRNTRKRNMELYRIDGYWDTEFHITDSKTGNRRPFLNVTTQPVIPKRTLPLDQQGPWESRKLWQRFFAEINKRKPKYAWVRRGARFCFLLFLAFFCFVLFCFFAVVVVSFVVYRPHVFHRYHEANALCLLSLSLSLSFSLSLSTSHLCFL